MLRQLAIFLIATALLSGCASSTKPGAIGVERSQLLIVSSDVINRQAATSYAKEAGKARSAGKLNSDAALTVRVQGISNNLIRQVGTFRPDAQTWKWEVNVFQSDELNAFCLPGGKIGVYTGLINRLSLTDSELAAIIGHEIAHALREHGREKVSQATLSSAIVQGLAASGHRYAGAHAALADLGSQLFVKLPYSREMESEADVIGLELMARAGYDPREASNVWKKMQAVSGGGRLEFLSTHPSGETRVAALDAAVSKVLHLYMAPELPGAQAEETVSSKAQLEHVAQVSEPPRQAKALPRGPDSIQVERLAREAGCHASPHGGLLKASPGLDSYQVACTSGTPMYFNCGFGRCKPATP